MLLGRKKTRGDVADGAGQTTGSKGDTSGLEAELRLEELFVGRPKDAAAESTAEVEDTRALDSTNQPAIETTEREASRQRRPWRLFGSRKAQRAPTPSISEQSDPATLAVGEPAGSIATPESTEVTPTLAPASKSWTTRRARRPRLRDPVLAVEVGGNRSLFWRLTPQGVEQVDQVPPHAKAISFSREDHRFEVEARLAGRQAQAMVLQEIGDPVQIVNRSKELGVIYAARQAHVSATRVRFGPGQALIDRLVRERVQEPAALIVGLDLKDSSGKEALLILYYLSASGRSSAPQVSVYPDNREFLLSQFAATHQAARENAQVLLLDEAALLSVADDLALYPIEPMLGPLPVRRLWLQATGLSMLAAAATALWAYQTSLQCERGHHDLVRAQEFVERAERSNVALLEASPRALSKTLSLDVLTAFTRAREVWVPGSHVRLTLGTSGTDLTVLLPLAKARTGRQNGALMATDLRAVNALLAKKPPAGCKRADLHFSETLNEAQLSIHCEASPHPLARYRDG